MASAPSRQAVRQKLAELLREPLERVANETRLRKLGRYDTQVARALAGAFGLALTDRQLQSLERVHDLLRAVEAATGTGVRPAPRPQDASPIAALPDLPVAAPPPAPEGTWESTLPYEEPRIHAAALSCSDGRLGEQIDEFLHRGLALPRYDRVACPGGPVALAGRLLGFWECRGVEEQIRFMMRVHRLGTVVLIAHEGCAYYRERLAIPARDLEAEQRRDLDLAAAAVVRMGHPVEVVSYFARVVGGGVRFEPV